VDPALNVEIDGFEMNYQSPISLSTTTTTTTTPMM